MAAYYNEFDPFAASWLRELIKDGLIADGVVDDRSITDVELKDLKDFTQCHFFAGIGGWSVALRRAMWRDDRHVWTGSCPCQPFSTAGKQGGASDERHLWPVWFRLIRECRPDVVFGEQVAGAAGFGWLDAVSTDLENENYAVGAAVLGAHSVGAPHIRQRLWFVADTECRATERHRHKMDGSTQRMQGEAREQRIWPDAWDGEPISELADSNSKRRDGQPISIFQRRQNQKSAETYRRGNAGELADCDDTGPQGRGGFVEVNGAEGREKSDGQPWTCSILHECTDGKARQIPAEPSFFPLVDGVPGNRVGILRGAGNAIVPQVAAAFIGAYLDVKTP